MKIALTLLMLAAFIVPPGALGAPTTTPKGAGTPDPPADAPRFNYTNMNRVQHTVPEGVPQVLRMGASTMEFRATQRLQLNISQAPGLKATYFVMNMEANRNMHVNMYAGNEPPADTPEAAFGLRRYFTLEGNGTEPFRATLRLFIDESGLAEELGRSIIRERLTWCYWNGTGWENVPSQLGEDGFLEAETSHFSVWTVAENKKPNEVPTPEIPGVPETTRAFNYTDRVPEAFKWTLREQESNTLQFRNTAMVFNSTRQVRLEITAQEDFRQRLFRLELQPSEALELQVRLQAERPVEVGSPENGLGFYCVIEPNATIPLQARLGVEVDSVLLQEQLGREVDPQRLTWAYWDGETWRNVESRLDDEGVLTAETDHFSAWTVLLEAESTEPTEPTQPETPTKQPPYLLYGAAALLILAVAGFLYTRKAQ